MVIRIVLLVAAGLTTLHRWKRAQEPPRCGLFSWHEFEQLNCGHYHDPSHAHEVADLIRTLGAARGYSKSRLDFLSKVGLLHDADLRYHKGDQEPRLGTPARVPVTVEWLLENRARLCQQLNWESEDMDLAVALIARTEFPFDHNPRAHGTRFDGLTPVQLYEQLLGRLSPQQQAEVVTDGLLLRFADQCSPYVSGFPRAVRSVVGLSREWANQGQAGAIPGLWENTPGFLTKIGQDLEEDRELCARLGIVTDLPAPEVLFRDMGWRRRYNFRRNLASFQKISPG